MKIPDPGDIRDSVSDITAAHKVFGFQTRYSLDEGLLETIQWFSKKAGILILMNQELPGSTLWRRMHGKSLQHQDVRSIV